MIISHYKDQYTAPQSNEAHQQGVASLASSFADSFGMGELGRILGLLHDKGKEQADFQTYIKKVSGMCPSLIVHNHPNHAYVGALIAKKLYSSFYPLLANPIMGHHAGLYDYPEHNDILKREIPADVDDSPLGLPLAQPLFMNNPQAYEFNHIVRMLFSCLVDADYLDTEHYMNPKESALRGNKLSLHDLGPKLDSYLAELHAGSIPSPVNDIRDKVQQACREASAGSPGFYSLTVPTGGGKTLSSLVWAVKHAIKHGKQRIVIAIPYTSIIVQTAQVLRNIFGEENVLEHHSNVNIEQTASNQETSLAQKLKLATENWDYPIVVTTNVQLFESMYSNKPSRCRKLHNLCNSVLILDEVQTLPADFLQPIVNGLKTYQRQFGMSVLLTTASQPVLEGTHVNPNNPRVKLEGIEKITEIIPENYRLYDSLRRVELHMEKGKVSPEELAKELSKHPRVLCIVNTRKIAQEIYSHLPKDGLTIHLSRMMCPKHISNSIQQVKDALKDDNCPVIRVIATQLIEAGVDIDFPVVYRQEAGLDSVLQAAGRCNREGKLAHANTYVFSLGQPLPPGHITQTNNARKNMLSQSYDWFSPEAMKAYFIQLYSRVNTYDKIDVKMLLENPREPMFSTAAQKFQLIDDNGISVIVNWEDSMELVEALKEYGPSYRRMKQLGQYTVSLYERDFNSLKQGGLVDEPIEGIYVIPGREQYDEKVGLKTDNHWLEEILIK